MSEQNMGSILDSIEEAYRKHRRHDVTSTLTTLIIEGISSHSSHLDSFVVLHAALISSLHKLVGVEFAAYLLQNAISAYERYLKAADQTTSEPGQALSGDVGKEASNLIVLLSELYNFQVISCILVYDIIRDLLSTALSELRVELLLKVLRNSGAQLRQDDPSALKDIVSLAQENLDKQSVSSSRTRFMMETLLNLKNNKANKKAATQHQGGDAVERLKKFLSGLGRKKHVLAHESLRVSLDDLRSAETKGKWWLVGAAWGGDPLVEQREELARRSGGASQKGKSDQDPTSIALAKLAKKQGMNTDIRRSIFVVIMTSDDYIDACERLAQLNLTEVQQREIIRVALRCCGNEKSYNPFYALVCQQLCQTSHSYKVTLQFCLWDFLRDLGETNVGGAEVIKNITDDGGAFDGENVSPTRIRNVAKAYAWWIARDCCTLMILKPVDFTVLKSQSRKFLRELFVQLFVASQVSSPLLLVPGAELPSGRNRSLVEEVFMKASRLENLAMGLTYFLTETFRKEEDLLKWGTTVARETLQTRIDQNSRL
ncbi:ARM repeat-containing protein [Coniophora puteana RWD-64-598 SS2]|uniref:ARM repeat-containing protein n=1 Tax=Coniophora puteana (strain RWD-64-598) TaxID=741705 RepID=A0A5M3MXT5_CONPW|nr:ARM repeat-containing protein [Coniophora puteana RWD-64-598 SS2]EIW83932.1 ARM repeat-containing protein [Coniophora puteana RWD-64-598 SS2]